MIIGSILNYVYQSKWIRIHGICYIISFQTEIPDIYDPLLGREENHSLRYF